MKKQVIDKDDRMWIGLGFKSFARFFGLSIEEAYKIISNPNEVFEEMIEEMDSSLNEYENFMVKTMRMDEKEELTRLDILDL
jgi:hypothetical protein